MNQIDKESLRLGTIEIEEERLSRPREHDEVQPAVLQEKQRAGMDND